jgi:hypothetical protein
MQQTRMKNGSREALFGARRDVRVMKLGPRLLLQKGLYPRDGGGQVDLKYSMFQK